MNTVLPSLAKSQQPCHVILGCTKNVVSILFTSFVLNGIFEKIFGALIKNINILRT